MKNSKERIKYITDYITSYTEKIEVYKKEGLFDESKLFELFALEVGALYLEKNLKNLNINTYQYPCVDLVSEDGKLFFQVSTSKDIPSKIKRTLEKIRDSKQKEIKQIKNVIFFMLDNDSVEKVIDLAGQNRIGQIDFIRKKNLITTNDIIDKAIKNLEFQISLYNLLKKEEDSINQSIKNFKEAIFDSKNIGIASIVDKINDEYSIDLSNYINQIQKENYKNVLIEGRAGSGKSVLCKKIVEKEELVLFARAERFLEESTINNIWHFNLSEVLEYLNNKRLFFFIDALEFIADNKIKLDLLTTLYERTKKYSNVHIIVSCRTSDKTAFIKLKNEYSIANFEIKDLTYSEQIAISKKYPFIKRMLSIDSYKELMKSPFYLNIIISKIKDIDSIADENELRDYIWQHIICLNDTIIKDTIKEIVFERAKKFLVGVNDDRFDVKIVERLESNNVIVHSNKLIRLKYDVFEDICFEQFIDEVFAEAKGDYNSFFENIESIGRCIYRRYQIWIENKLLTKENRDKFIYRLLLSKLIPYKWRIQTEIGLIKSRHSKCFFEEYGNVIVKEGLLTEFIDVVNLYGFELDNYYSEKIFLKLNSSGDGRGCIIKIIADNDLYKDWQSDVGALDKLIIDYSKSNDYSEEIAINAVKILTYFIDKAINSDGQDSYWKLFERLKNKLVAVYRLSSFCKDWMIMFFAKIINMFKGKEKEEKSFAHDVIKNLISFENAFLTLTFPKEMCDIFELFYMYKENHSIPAFYYPERKENLSFLYGFNENAESYEHESFGIDPTMCNFFYTLFCKNYWFGLEWMTRFVNKAVLKFKDNYNELPLYEINFIEQKTKVQYYGCYSMWLTTTRENFVPAILADLIYSFKMITRNIITNSNGDNVSVEKFVNRMKKYIFKESNNIILLTIISDIGMEFEKKFPGFALDLATNVAIVINDLERITLQKDNPIQNRVEREMMLTAGIPNEIKRRYESYIPNISLRDYVFNAQIFFDNDIKEKTFKILDYLYFIIPNDLDNAEKYLQIQQMDSRTARKYKINDETIALVPKLTGFSKQISDEQEKINSKYVSLSRTIQEINNKIINKTATLCDYQSAIKYLLEFKDDSLFFAICNNLIYFISLALSSKELDIDKREEYCNVWIEFTKEKMSNKCLLIDSHLFAVLFMQLDEGINREIKNDLKKIILDLILHNGNNGKIRDIARYAKEYLKRSEKNSYAIFYTILELAKDEMMHQKFNADYIKKNMPDKDFIFKPNMQPSLTGIDYIIKQNGEVEYQYNTENIINTYLFNQQFASLEKFDINEYDIKIISYALNCGLRLEDGLFENIVKQYVQFLIRFWHENKHQNHNHEIFSTYELYEAQQLLQQELIFNLNSAKKVLDIMFDEVDFSFFENDTLEFYLEVFGRLTSFYFDSYICTKDRQKCEDILKLLEKNIKKIDNEYIYVELSKSLILGLTTYGGSGDWSSCKTSFSYKDKMFLNDMFRKYGFYHVHKVLDVINKFHIDELLPEILLSLNDIFKNAPREEKYIWRTEGLDKILADKSYIIDNIINKSFFNFCKQIKDDNDLIKAYEEILNILIEFGNEKAAILLDEFRIH